MENIHHDIPLLDITDRNKDFKWVDTEMRKLDKGIRAVSIMYDEHSNDKHSKENIHRLRESINYRLEAAKFQYKLLLQEHFRVEAQFAKATEKDFDAIRNFIKGNPYFHYAEIEMSSIFDSIIFHLSSVFDYLSHITCYICKKKDKANTVYWTKLAKAARGKENELHALPIAAVIDRLDREFVGHLYDYRSRLLHNKRDQHEFDGKQSRDNKHWVHIHVSQTAITHFKIIKQLYPDTSFSLTYFSSWLMKHSAKVIGELFEQLVTEIKKDSYWGNNLYRSKEGDNAMIMLSVDPVTNVAKPVSETMWQEFLNMDTDPDKQMQNLTGNPK